MPFKKYTQKDYDVANDAPKHKGSDGLLHVGYWWDIIETFQRNIPHTGKEYADRVPFMQLWMNGKLRAGNGEKFPADWKESDFACYLRDYENEQKTKDKNASKEPALLLYDEDNHRFKKIYVNHFFDKENVVGTKFGDIIEDGYIELDVQKVPAENPEERANVTNLNWQIETDAVADVADALNELYSDLRKRDSIFSSNSPEYTKFYEGLKALRSQIVDEFGKPKTMSVEQLSAYFRDPENNVFAKAQEYLDAKTRQSGKLSDRQTDRMSMCRRFMSIQKAVQKAEQMEGKFPDFRTDILSATMTHKAILGTLKAAGPEAIKRELGNGALYDAHFQKLNEHIQNSYTSKEIKKCASGSPAEAAKRFTPLKIKKGYGDHLDDYAEVKKAMAKMDKSGTKWAPTAEYLMVRTHEMLEEMNTHDSFIHSSEQKQFRIALENLHDQMIGICDHSSFNKDKLYFATREITKIADAYQMHHLGDKAVDADMNAVHRLGFAQEIRIFNDFIATNEDRNPKELISKIAAHQQKMRELDQKYTTYREEQFKEGMDFSTEISPELQAAEKNFNEAFNDLISVYHYDKVLDQKVEEMKGTMVEGDEALLGIAITNNKTLQQVKAEAAAQNNPDPAKAEVKEEKTELINEEGLNLI